MKKMINVFLALIFVLALLASVTPKNMVADNSTLNNDIANANFKIPLPVDITTQSTLAKTETEQSDYASSEKLNTD